MRLSQKLIGFRTDALYRGVEGHIKPPSHLLRYRQFVREKERKGQENERKAVISYTNYFSASNRTISNVQDTEHSSCIVTQRLSLVTNPSSGQYLTSYRDLSENIKKI